MKTRSIHILTAWCLALLVSVGGCDSFSEINENPNAPEVVPENLQLSALLGTFGYEMIGNDPTRTPVHWVQQLAFSGTPPSEDNYDHDESDVNNLWTFTAYTDVMHNAKILSEQAESNGNFAYAAIAKTILAWSLGIVTDLWGDVPYSEAFNPDDPTPAYDAQEQVYAAIFDLLNQAAAQYDQPSPLSPGSDDLLYGGDMDNWKKLTYTVLARFHMHLTHAPGNSAADRAQQALAALQNGFTSNAEDADFAYFNAPDSENPWYQWVIDGVWDTRNQLSVHYVDLLKARDDPRLSIQARPVGAVDGNGLVPGFTTDDPVYAGHQNGVSGAGANTISSIGVFYSAPDAPLTWISYAEARFIEAEATLITSSPDAAASLLVEAITASMDKLGVNPADRDAYLAARPALTDANALEEIMIEKYIANFLNLETYNDWRRNGFPVLEPVTNQARATRIPLRYPYPSSELANNPDNVNATGIPLGLAALELPVWWDTTTNP